MCFCRGAPKLDSDQSLNMRHERQHQRLRLLNFGPWFASHLGMETQIVTTENRPLTREEITSIRDSYSTCTGIGAELVKLQAGQYVGFYNGVAVKEYIVNE